VFLPKPCLPDRLLDEIRRLLSCAVRAGCAADRITLLIRQVEASRFGW
jgi:hypothetical protein